MSERASPLVCNTHRLCAKCNQVKPVPEFYGEEHTCKECYRLLSQKDANDQCRELQQVLCNTTLRTLVAERKGERINAPHISECVAVGVEKLGGVDKMMQTYVDCINAAIQEDPASRKTLDHLRKFLDLIVASTEHRSSAPDVEGLTEEEIMAEYRELSMQAIVGDADKLKGLLRMVHDKAPQLLEFDDGDS